jgi:hypothetical protein
MGWLLIRICTESTLRLILSLSKDEADAPRQPPASFDKLRMRAT